MPYKYSHVGDPGVFSFLGGALKGIARNLPGPAGTLARTILPERRAPRRPTARSFRDATRSRPFRPTGLPRPGPVAAFQRAIPGGQSGMEAPPRGYRLNKSDYFLKDGTFVAAGTRFVKTRSRNPANTRALRRALSRVESFGGLVKRARKTTRKLKNI